MIRDDAVVLGAGWIDSIETAPARKVRYRCPACTRAGVKLRSKSHPKWRCPDCGAEFDKPIEEELQVIRSIANYSRTWRPADQDFPHAALTSAYVAESWQHAIRRLDPPKLRPILEGYLRTGDSWWEKHVREEERIPGGHSLAMAKTRLGQQRFREAMLKHYGEACAFTGPQPPGALQAAHLYLYSKNPRHDPHGGLLLRCDLHALFDRWLITIDPDNWTIQLAPQLVGYPDLAKLNGQPVLLAADLRPREIYVRDHADAARASWKV